MRNISMEIAEKIIGILQWRSEASIVYLQGFQACLWRLLSTGNADFIKLNHVQNGGGIRGRFPDKRGFLSDEGVLIVPAKGGY